MANKGNSQMETLSVNFRQYFLKPFGFLNFPFILRPQKGKTNEL
jgi:hypothetical protein